LRKDLRRAGSRGSEVICYYRFQTMNRLIIVFIIFVFTTGCNSQNNGTNSTIKSTDNNNFDKEQLIKQATLIDGEWLSDNYLRNVEKTKSIYLNREYNTRLFGFVLNKENLYSDTAYLNGFSEHEGGAGSPIIFDPKKNKFVNDLSRIKEFSGIPDSFEMTVIRDSIVEMFFSKTKIIDTYRKVTDEQTGLRKILFAGNYSSIDKKKKVSLPDEILRRWKKESTEKRFISDFISALNYRDWLAHGRYWTARVGRRYDFYEVYSLAVSLERSLGLNLDAV